MSVTVSGRSGLRNAYVSVLSAEGSSEIKGASRWLDASAAEGLPPRDVNAASSAPTAAAPRSRTASLRMVGLLLSDGRSGSRGGRRIGPGSVLPPDRFGPNRSPLLGESPPMGNTPRLMPRSFAHLSDEAVVALMARSDESALAELYDRFGRVAYGLALRVLRDQTLAEDAVQEGFLAAWRNAGRFIPERGRAGTWLLTLVHRRAVDLVRREGRRRAEPLREDVEPARAGSGGVDARRRIERQRRAARLSD